MLFSLPNLLTLSRIGAVPLIVAACYLDDPIGSMTAFTVFVVAGITDFFDGYLARAQGLTSKLGQFLDPIADKLMIGAVIIMLVGIDRISGVHVVAAVIIMCREILVSGLREFLAGLKVSVPVTQLAKWKTTLQMVALGALLLAGAGLKGIPALDIGLWSLWAAAGLTMITGYDYLRAGLRHMT
ncbi:MAG: CDP-diacylglycerol--glycerol-3-phosphate 3-phosphatidyltransferase [Pseudomonadota bacterium]